MADSPKFDLQYLEEGATDNVDRTNRNLTLLETLAQASVISREFIVAPTDPAEGDFYYIEGSPTTGTWANKNRNFALFLDADWVYIPIVAGVILWDDFDNEIYIYNGTDLETFGQKRLFQYSVSAPATLGGKVPLFSTPGRIWIDSIETVLMTGGEVNMDVRQGPTMNDAGTLLTEGTINTDNVSTTGTSWNVVEAGQPAGTAGIWLWSSLFTTTGTPGPFNLTIKYHTL